MDKNKILTILFPFLLAVAIYVWASPGVASPRKISRSGSKTSFENASMTKDELKALVQGSFSVKISDSEAVRWGDRNPFDVSALEKSAALPPVVQLKKKTPVYYLSGIIWNDEKPSAIINDSVVRVGSVIDAATVKSIAQDRVILNSDDKDMTLLLRSDH